MKRRDFIKSTTVLALGALSSSSIWALSKNGRLRTAHIGVGGMGRADLASISSHEMVDVVALCDVDSNALAAAKKIHPNAVDYADYRVLLQEMKNNIDAVIVSTPDHTHAPASMMAMEIGKPVYCQKPLTHHVAEARAMRKLAKEKILITQMGIQVHSFYDYKLATLLIQSGIIGKVKSVRAWSPKNWGYDGPGAPEKHKDLILPNNEKLPDQGAMFIGKKGRLLLPHFMKLPKHIVDGKYADLDLSVIKKSDHLGSPTKDYSTEGNKHYH